MSIYLALNYFICFSRKSLCVLWLLYASMYYYSFLGMSIAFGNLLSESSPGIFGKEDDDEGELSIGILFTFKICSNLNIFSSASFSYLYNISKALFPRDSSSFKFSFSFLFLKDYFLITSTLSSKYLLTSY